MSAAIPVVEVEIFRGPPGFADDNFVKGWTKTSGGTSTFSTDGDVASLNKGDQSFCSVEKTLSSLSTDTYTKAQIKVTAISGTLNVYVWDGSGWVFVVGITTVGVTEATIPSGKTITKIEFAAIGTASIDYVFISKTAMLTPAVDLAQEMDIDLPLLEMGVSGASLNIPNSDGAYTNLIGEFDRIIIYLYRQGATQKKMFGGKVTEVNSKGRQSEYWISLKCMGLGEQLHAPTALVQKCYSAVNGKIIITDALANCGALTDKFVDVDSDISSTHTITCDEVLAYEVITEICKKATTIGGVIGFDAYVDTAGNLYVFKRGKYISTVDLTGKIEEYAYNKDIHRIRNKIKVYGAKERRYPATDEWCESLTNWTGSSAPTLDLDAKVGTYSIEVEGAGGVWLQRTFAIVSAQFQHDSKQIIFWIEPVTPVTSLNLVLYAPDSSNYYWRNITEHVESGAWVLAIFDIGPENEDEWTKVGNPTWTNIQAFHLSGSFAQAAALRVDDLHFGKAAYYGLATDNISIAKYGARFAVPQIDEELTSDAECVLKAQSLVDFLKETIISFQNMLVEGNNAYVRGDKQLVQIANDVIDGYFRILGIRHVVGGVNWDTFLTLSNEPKMIDYIYASTASPRYAGATVIVPRDFSTIQDGINAVVID